MTHILELIDQQQKEIEMAKSKLKEPVCEVAQIVIYLVHHNGIPIMVKYTDMKSAHKDFERLNKAREKAMKNAVSGGFENVDIILSGPVATMIISNCFQITAMYLVDVEGSNALAVDTQRRMNAMAALPQ